MEALKIHGSLYSHRLQTNSMFRLLQNIFPTSKPETHGLILLLAAKENFTLQKMDVKPAHLHPAIREELSFEQTIGFKKLDGSSKKLVYWLNKSIYHLKHAATNWYEELAKFLIKQNFVRSKNDYCRFSKNEIYKNVSSSFGLMTLQ